MKKLLIEITKKLISFKTVNPPGNESNCTPYLKKLLTRSGFNVKVFTKKKSRANVIGEIGNGKKSLVVACHIDTVPAGPNWKTNPFKAIVKNNRIYGRGAIDDKGPFAVSFCAVKNFVKQYPDFDGKIYLVALADEEQDNIYGVKYLLQNGFTADAGLIPDGAYLNQVDYGEKGVIQLRIDSFGKQEHSALQENGQNAIENLSRLVNNLIGQLKFTKFDRQFSPLKINVSLFHGGEFANVIPAKAYAQMDIRYPLGLTEVQVMNKINQIVGQTKGRFRLNTIYTTKPHLVKNSRLINAFVNAGKTVKMKIKPITLAGNSVAKEFTEAGIPSIVHYPMNKITAHEPNEYITIKNMVKTVNLYQRFFEFFFFTSRKKGALT